MKYIAHILYASSVKEMRINGGVVRPSIVIELSYHGMTYFRGNL